MLEVPELSDKRLLKILSLAELATAIYTGPKFIISSANAAMLALWGKDENVIGLPIEQALPELIGQPFPELLKMVWNTGNSFEDTNAQAKLIVNGLLQPFYFDYKYRAVTNDKGEMECILNTAVDVTAQNLTQAKFDDYQEASNKEMALHQHQTATNKHLLTTQTALLDLNARLSVSEGRFRSLIEQIPTAINIFESPDLIIDLPNDRMLEIWDRTAREVVGKPLVVAMPELKGQPFLQRLADVLTTGKAYHSRDERAFIERNGVIEECYFNIIYQPIINDDGTITSILQICNEVTKEVLSTRRILDLNQELAAINEELISSNEEQALTNDKLAKANEDLQHTSETLQIAINSAALGTWRVDANKQYVYLSARSKQLFGLPQDTEITIASLLSVIDPAYHQLGKKAMNDAFTHNAPCDITFLINNAILGKPMWLRAFGKVSFDRNSEADYFSGMLMDVTEQRRDEERKNDFIGMVSHEMKTPLTSLNGYIQILQKKAANGSDGLTISLLDKAKKQLDKMVTMINGFLNISRLESGKIYIDKQPFDMADLIREVKEEAIATIASHIVLFEPVEHTPIHADRDKIGHVIDNLISNAVKYSPRGTIINVACVTRDGCVEICVKDRGVGIAPKDIDKLFDRYYRVEGEQMKIIGGFGIGLYLCKEIVQRHEGEIWVASELGKGSTFCFTLPAQA